MFPEDEKAEFCEGLECDEKDDLKVCGIRYEGEVVMFKVFDNECKLLQYGCRVDDTETYGLTGMKYCREHSTTDPENIEHVQFINNCCNCTDSGGLVCGIRPDGEGFKIRIFKNECQLKRYNCDNDELQFTATDFFICSSSDSEEEMSDEEESTVIPEENEPYDPLKTKNLVVVRSMLDPRNVNKSISNFFAATHHFDLRLKNIQSKLNESTRRRIIKIYGPVKVFEPWTNIPKNISEDYWHEPTLNSCYHKCPTKCPDVYAPVCGVPGIAAREPRVTFQNHCFMDVAQCKLRYEAKNPVVVGSAYVEQPFLFCLGPELNSLHRFLPLIKTLQHMGRLRKKGHYRNRLRNWKFANNHPAGKLNVMG
ncbi:hypothetical protein PYW07_004357 [Mythimna separata]|uniref:Kazal-like domain-containing protein n=1 Tax=Mythimna separata TaxID=271217 RepID=A0AAD7YWZ6_MYTSE|nr:hypothetical protein PYW07_004357 [Mythimna separata]